MGTKRIEHIVEDGVEKKHCATCKTFKPLEGFSSFKQTWDKLSCYCCACQSLAGKIKRRGPDFKEEEDYGRVPHVTEDGVEKKWCGTCKVYKALDMFSRYTRSWDGRRYKCNACLSQANKRERHIETRKAWLANNSIRGHISSRMRNALKRVGSSKSERSLEFLGCSVEKFKIYIESHFAENMKHSNYPRWEYDHHYPVASFDMTNPVHQKACFHYKNYRPLWAQDNRMKSSKYDKEEWNLYMKRFVETYIM